MEPRSSLASQGSGRRSGLALGVHFGETPATREGADGAGASSAAAQALAKGTPLSEQLIQELDHISPLPTPARSAQIEEALAEVLSACRAVAQQLDSSGGGGGSGDGAGEALLPLGSYHLGVGLPNDQIDVLFVAPLSLQVADLPKAITAELTRRGSGKDFAAAGPDGLLGAPGLQFEVRGVWVKVLISQRIPLLPQPRPEAIVQNMAAIYAQEATAKMLQSVPNPDLFRGLLRFVRFWAKQRGIYGSFLGFPGGMAWAVCCARVCQMYPNIELSHLAARFFRAMSRWEWRQPVTVEPPGSAPAAPPSAGASGGLDFSAGAIAQTILMNPLMPVGPGLPAATTVSPTTMKIVQKELRRAYKKVQHVELGRAHWTDVYSEARFFQRHRHYLQLDFMAANEAVQAAWLAWGKQQLQDLVRLFESMSSNIVTLRPWPEWTEFKDTEWPKASAIFLGLHLERNTGDGQQEGPRRSFDLREPIVKFLEAISSWPEAEQNANKFELLIKHVRAAELEQWLDNRQKGNLAAQGHLGTVVQGVGNQARNAAISAASGQLAITEEDIEASGLRECSL